MRLSYDPVADAAYIVFEDGKFEVTTQRLTEDVAVNYSQDGRIVGIEILSAREHLFKGMKEPVVTLENFKIAA